MFIDFVVMASAPSSISVLRIPAWKRLGLKLKFARDLPTESESPTVTAGGINEHKRKHQTEDRTKRKKIKSSSNTKVHSSVTASQSHSLITPTLKRQKFVTFTPETKTEDGDSIKLLFNNLATEPKLAFLEKNSGPTSHAAGVEQTDPSQDEAERRVKRVKKSETTKPNKIVKPRKHPINSAVEYLKQFYHSKETWKFNKVHQIQLLKNVFDVEKIPSEYSELVYAYMSSMKGGARTQLRDSALAIKVRDREERGEREGSASAEKLDSIRRKEEEFEAAVKEHVASMTTLEAPSRMGYEEGVLLGLSDFAMKKRMAKRMRAERILELLVQGYDEPIDEIIRNSPVLDDRDDGETVKRLRLNDGTAQKIRRRRKLRTNAVDESSSSSDSSSSSEETSDDESTDGSTRGDGSTSSSSSSSSSGGEESGDGSTDETETETETETSESE